MGGGVVRSKRKSRTETLHSGSQTAVTAMQLAEVTSSSGITRIKIKDLLDADNAGQGYF